MKSNKAPGEDCIPADQVKDASDVITPKLAHFFTECIKQVKHGEVETMKLLFYISKGAKET